MESLIVEVAILFVGQLGKLHKKVCTSRNYS